MISLASPGMTRELRRLWQTCFEEPARPVNLFLRTAFRPENCAVLLEGERLAAAVHLLPCRVLLPGGAEAKAHYVYAAATFPEFRGRGCMTSLLGFAAELGAARGQAYSVVLPAHEGLVPLYEKAGYAPFFSVTQETADARLISANASPPAPGRRLASFSQLCARRREVLSERPGSVLWDENAFFYAAESARVYGGKLLVCGEGETLSWALCGMADGCCEVAEWMAHPAKKAELLGLLLRACPAPSCRFRLPAGGEPLFSGSERSEQPFGMLRALGENALPAVFPERPPYLGLSLD